MEDADEGWPTAPGTTALSIALPRVDPLVRRWRARYDTGARGGGSAHVTVLFPFLPVDEAGPGVHAALTALFAAHPPFTLRFARFGRFPGVLYLVPEPDDVLRGLTKAVTERWPHLLPYGGVLGEVNPHLTLANTGPAAAHATIEADLAAGLPVTEAVESVDLVVYDGTGWRSRSAFSLGRRPGAGAASG